MMKNLGIVFFILISNILTVNSQITKVFTHKEFVLDTTEVSYENKLRPALSYEVDVDAKSLKKHWKAFVSRSFDASSKLKEKKVLATEDVFIASISDKRMNLYSVIIDKEKISKISFMGAFGYDIYIDSDVYLDEFNALKWLSESFLLESCSLHYADNNIGYLKDIGKLEKSIMTLERKNAGITNSIKEIDDQLVVLDKTKEEDSSVSEKITKKIDKITQKKIIYEADVLVNENEIKKKKTQIETLKEQISLNKKTIEQNKLKKEEIIKQLKSRELKLKLLNV